MDAHRFREAHDYAVVHRFASGLPTFHELDRGDGLLYGTQLLAPDAGRFREVAQAEYEVTDPEAVPDMFRGAARYAQAIGASAAYPTFHVGDPHRDVVYGTVILRGRGVEVREVPRHELEVLDPDDVPRLFAAAHDYAREHGFAGCFPTFNQRDAGGEPLYELVLLRNGTLLRELPADLLAKYSGPPRPWAIVLCRLSDVPEVPGSDQRYIDFFTARAGDPGGAYHYWRDVSYGQGAFGGSQIFGWFDVGHTTAEMNQFGGGAQRQKIAEWGLEAARVGGVPLASFPHHAVVLSSNADHGAVWGAIVFAYADGRALEPTFMFHEMGHGLGFDHSFSQQTSPCASGDGRPGAYCDPFDIMSAMAVSAFSDAQGRLSGPRMNAVNVERAGWLHRSRVWEGPLGLRAATVTLAALDRPDVNGFLAAKVPDLSGGGGPVYVELRRRTGWDRGLGRDVVLLHQVGADGLVRLLTDARGGQLVVGEEFVTPGLPPVVVRVAAIDAAAATATLRIWALNTARWRTMRIVALVYDPPGPDLAGEHLIIRNDSPEEVNLQSWRLIDAAGNDYVFDSRVLQPGDSVALWSKRGQDTAEELYWGRRQSVWNDRGDTAALRDATGSLRSLFTYGDGGR